ncbi:MAG: hypothetical protein H6707_07770 [Deltaproteobacteria bacterium]|nr:hypothetical protein [Deltaproteobacteria bacterium]
MSTPRIGRNSNRLELAPARARQTERNNMNFKSFVGAGVNVLLAGARGAARTVGLPVLSATAADGTPANATSSPSSTTSALTSAPSQTDSHSDLQQAMDARANQDLELLVIQSKIQQQNRQFTLVSNVMKARHDTAKAAISNLRA